MGCKDRYPDRPYRAPPDMGSVEDLRRMLDRTNERIDQIIGRISCLEGDDMIINTNNPTGDAFGRLRVSNPQTIFDSKQIHDDPDLASSVENQPIFFDNQQTSGSGTTTAFDVNKAQTTIAVSGSTAGTRVRQTRQRFNYQPGKSQLSLLTFVMNSSNASGVTRRIGMFDENNGLFFDDNGANYGFVRRTNTSGTPVDNRIEQSLWNADTFDGNGDSGITLDLTKTQILVIDFEWLGVGRVRMGWNINGVTYWAHEFFNSNILPEVYMSTPNAPVRTEITNSGSGAAASISAICSSVMSEGGQEPTGIVRTAGTAGTHVNANTTNTWYAIVGMRLRAEFIGKSIEILHIAMQEQAGTKQLEWGLFFNPTVAGTFTYSGVSRSAIEIATGATANTVTNGFQVAGGFLESSGASSGSAGSALGEIPNTLKLGSLIDGTVDQLVLCAKPIAGSTNADVEGLITWRELS